VLMLGLMSFTRSAPVGMDLVPLKRALDNNDLDALNVYLSALPQRSKNELFKAAGEKFGFKTEEVEAVGYMLAADLAQRLHRYSDTSPIRQLLQRWNWPLVWLRRVEHYAQLLFKGAFKPLSSL
jgi:hypothetical protein